MLFPQSVAIFCRVVDNFGDAGVCWRLARQFAFEHRLLVYLVIDDLSVLHKLECAIQPMLSMQVVQQVTVLRWNVWHLVAQRSMVDAVIEGFGCTMPPEFLHILAKFPVKPIWINLEYLSAESWIDDFHCMTSPHAFLSLTKHFFFPGFALGSGGLLREKGLLAQRDRFQNPVSIKAFFAQRNIKIGHADNSDRQLLVSLFCYSNAPVQDLLSTWEDGLVPILCFVPEGVASEAISAFLAQKAVSGASRQRGKLTIQVFSLMKQSEYDRLLWACDINFVRGEDSFVRAQWAGRPAVWQIYPQDDGAHWIKLDAFVERYTSSASHHLQQALKNLFYAWNGKGDISVAWGACSKFLVMVAPLRWNDHAYQWANELSKQSDLATRLLQYIRKLG